MESHDLKKFGKNAKRNNSVECQYFYGILQGGKKGGVHSTPTPQKIPEWLSSISQQTYD